MLKPGEEEDPRPTELKRLFVREISLVDRPANKREFLLYKSDGHKGDSLMPETLTKEEAEGLSAALNAPYDSEEAFLAKVDEVKKDLTKAHRDAIKGAFRLIQSCKDDVGEDMMRVVMDLAGLVKAEKKKDDEPEPKIEPKPVEKKDETQLSEVEKAHAAELSKRDEKIDALEKAVTGLLDEKDDSAVTALVAEMNLPGMSAQDQEKLFKTLPADVRAAFGAWAPAITKAIDMTTVGTSRHGEPAPESAQAETMQKARALVEKDASGKLDLADALLTVRAADPSLAERTRLEDLKGGQ
jgi:hypothetical protein